MTIALAILVFSMLGAFGFWLDHHYPCGCGRTALGYFNVKHERGGVMLAHLLWIIIPMGASLINHSYVWSIINALLLVWSWRRWWKHESGKYKKRAAKALGKVGVNNHGRLVTE